MTIHIDGMSGLQANVGRHIGYSRWHRVTEDEVHSFAEVTGDRQWIHVDAARAASEGPFGGPVAHGLLTLALGPMLLGDILQVSGFRSTVNYGYNRIRFPSPVPVGARVRMGALVRSVAVVPGGAEATFETVFEREGATKPVCVAEKITRYVV